MLVLIKFYRRVDVTSSAVERFFLLVLSLLLISCNGDNVPDCFQNAGEMVRRPVDVSEFSAITVFENLKVVLKQGNVHQVEVETGEYLLKNRLLLKLSQNY